MSCQYHRTLDYTDCTKLLAHWTTTTSPLMYRYVRDSMKQLVIFAALLLLLMMTSTVVFQSRSLYAYVRIDISDILQQQDSQVSQCIYCSSLSCTVPFTASFLGPGWGVLRYLNVLAVLIRSYCRTPAFYYDWWWLPPPPHL